MKPSKEACEVVARILERTSGWNMHTSACIAAVAAYLRSLHELCPTCGTVGGGGSEVRRLARAEHDRLGWLLEEVLYSVDPLEIEHGSVTDNDLRLLRAWASVGDSVWGSVWAYIGSLFPCVTSWRYVDHKLGEYPFATGADLWRRGLVPSFDGRTWRLHGGPDMAVVWSGTVEDMQERRGEPKKEDRR